LIKLYQNIVGVQFFRYRHLLFQVYMHMCIISSLLCIIQLLL